MAIMNKLQFNLKKIAVDEAKKAIETAQTKSLINGGPIIVTCFKNVDLIVEVAREFGFKAEVYEKQDIGFDILLF